MSNVACKCSLSRLIAVNARFIPGARRTLFSLPDLSSLSPFPNSSEPSESQTYHERKILPYTPKQLYKIVADVGSYPRFVPFCAASRIIRGDNGIEDGVTWPTTMHAEMTVGFLAFKESYVSKVTCIPFESVEAVATSSTPLFKTLATTWRFHSTATPTPQLEDRQGPHHVNDDEGPTMVTLDLTYAFANPLHAAVSATFFGQVSKQMVRAFEGRCLTVYGSGVQ